jgi:hypothetical protein
LRSCLFEFAVELIDAGQALAQDEFEAADRALPQRPVPLLTFRDLNVREIGEG